MGEFIIMSIVRLSIVLLSMVFMFSSAAVAEDVIAYIGQAAVVRGEVYVERNDMKHPLKARDKVYQGDKVITGDKGKVQIIFADDTIFTVGREAEILLDKFVYDPATHDGNSEIKAKKGTFKFVTGKIAKKNPKHVQVKTPFATIGVRGSGGIVDVAPTGETTLGLTQCCLDIYSNGNPNQPPVPLDNLGDFSQVSDPNLPPTAAAPMPPAMMQQMNGDLNGGFAPEEGEGDNPPPVEEGANNSGNNQPAAEENADNGDNNDGGQPQVAQKNDPNKPGVNAGPAPDGTAGDFADAGAPPPPPPGDFNNLDDGGFNFGGFDTAGADDGFNVQGAAPVAPLDSFLLDTASTNQDGTTTNLTTADSSTFTHSGIFRTRALGAGFANDRLGTLSGRFLDGGGFFSEFSFSGSTDTFTGILPTAIAPGSFGFSSIAFNDRILSGNGFRTLNGSMLMYNLIDDVTGERLLLTTGTAMTAAQIAGITGQTFFNFLPDFLSADTGFFDFSTVGTNEVGLVVDWDRDLFFGGDLKLDASGGGELHVGFGSLGGTNLADGFIFNLDSNGTFGEGTIAVNDVYGDGTKVDGMLIHTTNITGNVTTYDINPAVVTQPTAQDLALLTNRTTGTLQGFAAGHMQRDINGSPSFVQLSSGALGNSYINIYKNTSSGIGADFTLTDGGSFNVNATFGTIGAEENAFISDSVYAMEQSAMNLGLTPDAVETFSGVLVSDVVAEQKCDACQYAHWGVWAATVDEAAASGQVDTYQDVVRLLPYVVGEPTSAGDITAAISGAQTIDHSGMMFGSLVANGTDISHHYGNFTLAGAFNSGFTFDGNWAGFNMNATLTPGQSFSGSLNVTGLATGTGSINGAFFGPNAVDVGGNFDFAAGNYNGAGIYVGSDTP